MSVSVKNRDKASNLIPWVPITWKKQKQKKKQGFIVLIGAISKKPPWHLRKFLDLEQPPACLKLTNKLKKFVAKIDFSEMQIMT